MSTILGQWPDLFPVLLPGLWVSIKLTLAALVIGLALGLCFALAGTSSRGWLKWLSIGLVELFRGLPGLIMLYLIYYGLPQVGLTLPNFIAASVALGITTGAYTSEIIRAGITAVPRGQREASRALGLKPWKELRLVVLPQALRIVIPPLIGYGIILFQGTSLAFAISTPELLSRAYNAASISFQYTAALTLAGLMYLVISIAGVLLTGLWKGPGRSPRSWRLSLFGGRTATRLK